MKADQSMKEPGAGFFVLLVEDYEPNIVVATTFLEELGHSFEVARNGLDALRKFSAARYDIIFMDLQLPDIDGLEITRKIRIIEKENNIRATPIVALTARATEDDRLLCLKAGMNECLAKPFQQEQLKNILLRFAGSAAAL